MSIPLKSLAQLYREGRPVYLLVMPSAPKKRDEPPKTGIYLPLELAEQLFKTVPGKNGVAWVVARYPPKQLIRLLTSLPGGI